MPVTVKVPTLLRPHVGGMRAVEATGGTLRELFQDLERRYPGVTDRVLGPNGDLHRFVNVYLNDEDVRYLGALDARVGEGDTVAILPAVAGGVPDPVGRRLREARQRAGMSQTELEAASGIPKPRISRYENGHIVPSIPILRKLAAGLGVRPGELLDGG